jgi:membrane protein implicated in regulation of membrane protease activity
MRDRKRRTKIFGHTGREQLTLKVVLRYALIQLPGTVLLALVILLINRSWVAVPLWLGLGIVGLAIVKDLVLFPFLWRSYAGGDPDDPSSMIGRRGIVIGRLDPEGHVRVSGELWRAEAVEDDRPVEEGRNVAVVGVSGLKLFVRTDSQVNGPAGPLIHPRAPH